MKSIMLSIKPKHCANILNGLKTIEIRKIFPSNYRGWVYIYCTKDKKYGYIANGKSISQGFVIARFYCDDVKEITPCKSLLFSDEPPRKNYYFMGNECQSTICLYACLSMKDLDDYLQGKNGYAIHISQLEIFDTPKELSEFKHLVKYKCETCTYNNEEETNNRCAFCEELLPVKKAPQNLMYIEVEE